MDVKKCRGSRYHVTEIREGNAYGHRVSDCNAPYGCTVRTDENLFLTDPSDATAGEIINVYPTDEEIAAGFMPKLAN